MVMASDPQEFEGSCHCTALGFSFTTALPLARWSVRACQCRFCRAHGALTTSDPAGRLAFHANGTPTLQRYRFGLKTADFLLCTRCGVYLGAQIETTRGAFGIVNVRAIVPTSIALPDPAAADYGAEDAAARISRREKRWTPMREVL
jgi:hypothetical protein